MTSSVDADIEKRLLLDDDDHSAPHHNTNDQRWEYATNQYTQLEVDDSETTPLSRPIGTATDETDIEATEEPKSYRLPTEGGSIFASFVYIRTLHWKRRLTFTIIHSLSM